MNNVKKIVTSTLIICLMVTISCYSKNDFRLTGKYKCTTNKSYFIFLSENTLKYQDTRIYPTLFYFKYKIKKNNLVIEAENGNYNVNIKDNNTLIWVKHIRISPFKHIKTTLIYRRIENI